MVPKKRNLFDIGESAEHHVGEFVEIIAKSDSGAFRVERIVSRGDSSPEGFWYCQNEDEFVAVLSGSAELSFGDSSVKMSSGDYILIEKNVRHRVEKTSVNPPCVWLTAFGNFSK